MLFLSNGASSWFGKHIGRMMSVKCPSSLRVGSSILFSSCKSATLYTDSVCKPWLGSVWYFGWISIRLIFIQSGARATTLDVGYCFRMLKQVFLWLNDLILYQTYKEELCLHSSDPVSFCQCQSPPDLLLLPTELQSFPPELEDFWIYLLLSLHTHQTPRYPSGHKFDYYHVALRKVFKTKHYIRSDRTSSL